MIQVPYSLSELDKMALTFYKDIKKEFDISSNLKSYAGSDLKPVMNYLETNLKRIITGRPDQLELQMKLLDNLVKTAKSNYLKRNPLNSKKKPTTTANVNTWFKTEILKIFNYDTDEQSFTKKEKGKIAYRHAKRLDMNTCPYCNANFTFTIRNKRMKSRPQFDHFYNKNRYPYLALSFYNLVPSCALCNSGALKGQKPFSLATNIHPFIESLENVYQFRTKVKSVDFLVSGKDFELKMNLCKGIKVSNPIAIKAKRNVEVFALNDRYKYHKDIAGNVIKNSYMYCNTSIDDLYETFKIGGTSIFKSELEIKELIVGNYLDPINFHKRIHTKLVKDIAEEFGIVI
ncbi:hypothetical protein SAMN02927916_3178 [Flavobacterium anhuiense]|uniref:HNH nuclease domain-containing protein n=1 Tax=Flavobacterium anhuiense TaxID=459526 RepID=A0ABY0LWY7_9FLAO|nr:hypothetical protein [Flavobacterium anhuiense]SCY75052.1 hypothetical protein SAMN02927916_3178 [Flavobacterium anhuiense]